MLLQLNLCHLPHTTSDYHIGVLLKEPLFGLGRRVTAPFEIKNDHLTFSIVNRGRIPGDTMLDKAESLEWLALMQMENDLEGWR